MTKCPQCGFVEYQEKALVTNVMKTYVDASTGKVDGIYNNHNDEFKITLKGGKEVTLVEKSVWESRQAKKAAIKAPAVVPTTVVSPASATTLSNPAS